MTDLRYRQVTAPPRKCYQQRQARAWPASALAVLDRHGIELLWPQPWQGCSGSYHVKRWDGREGPYAWTTLRHGPDPRRAR